MKCSEVWLGEVKMGRNEVPTTVVKWSKGLSNRVSVIIRRYIDHMRLQLIWLFRLSHFFHILFVLLFIILFMVVCFVCFCLIL